MAGQLLPPPELAPPVEDLTPEQGIRRWIELMDLCEAFLLAGLRREVGPDGDIGPAYREWYARWQEDHDAAMLRMMEAFNRSQGDGG